jgi:hypothetical protein
VDVQNEAAVDLSGEASFVRAAIDLETVPARSRES